MKNTHHPQGNIFQSQESLLYRMLRVSVHFPEMMMREKPGLRYMRFSVTHGLHAGFCVLLLARYLFYGDVSNSTMILCVIYLARAAVMHLMAHQDNSTKSIHSWDSGTPLLMRIPVIRNEWIARIALEPLLWLFIAWLLYAMGFYYAGLIMLMAPALLLKSLIDGLTYKRRMFDLVDSVKDIDEMPDVIEAWQGDENLKVKPGTEIPYASKVQKARSLDAMLSLVESEYQAIVRGN